jgi:hypothetical protein
MFNIRSSYVPVLRFRDKCAFGRGGYTSANTGTKNQTQHDCINNKQTIAAVNVDSTSRIIERYIPSVAVGVRPYFRSMLFPYVQQRLHQIDQCIIKADCSALSLIVATQKV